MKYIYEIQAYLGITFPRIIQVRAYSNLNKGPLNICVNNKTEPSDHFSVRRLLRQILLSIRASGLS